MDTVHFLNHDCVLWEPLVQDKFHTWHVYLSYSGALMACTTSALYVLDERVIQIESFQLVQNPRPIFLA